MLLGSGLPLAALEAAADLKATRVAFVVDALAGFAHVADADPACRRRIAGTVSGIAVLIRLAEFGALFGIAGISQTLNGPANMFC